MNRILKYLVIAAPVLWISCGDENIIRQVDPVIQRNADLEIIEEYVAEKGYPEPDTTAAGARYVILEEGTGADIDLNDNVSFYYTLGTTDDVVHLTNIKLTAIESGIYDSTRVYEPRVFTLTESVWPIPSIVSTGSSTYSETGFKQGLVAATSKMNVGGHAVLLLPSDLMYGSTTIGTIEANSVIVMDIFPVFVRPQ